MNSSPNLPSAMARKKKTERRSGPSDDDDELPAHLQILNVGRDRGERQSG